MLSDCIKCCTHETNINARNNLQAGILGHLLTAQLTLQNASNLPVVKTILAPKSVILSGIQRAVASYLFQNILTHPEVDLPQAM